MKNGYAVVWTGSGAKEAYQIETMHRTLEAAEVKAAKILRATQRGQGNQNNGSFSRVFRVEDGQIMEQASNIGVL